jgi:hypothetical protein
MEARRLILLSPYRYPTQNPLVLGNDEMACWLNAHAALWHPAALWQAAGPPRVDVPYEYEQPTAGHLYAVPESPPLFLPDDWEERVGAAGAALFKATPDRKTTLANLKEALARLPPAPVGDLTPESPPLLEARARLLALPAEQVAPFLGIGLGYLLQLSLSEAMEHESLLEAEGFWQDVQQAVADLAGVPYTPPPEPTAAGAEAGDPDHNPPATDYVPPPDYSAPPPADDGAGEDPPAPADEAAEAAEPWRRSLASAAGRLQAAREVLYPVTIHLIDVAVLDGLPSGQPWPASFGLGLPLNLVASGAGLEGLARDQSEHLADLRRRAGEEQVEVCGGCYLDREDVLLPVESQLWDLRKGLAVSRELLGREVTVFARRRFAAQPQLPLLLSSNGLTRAIVLSQDDAALPQSHAPVVGWPSPDGKQVDVFVRKPHPAAAVETWFNLGHHLFKTTREDHVATLAFLHAAGPAAPWYADFVELARFGPIVGRWTTFSRYFNDTMAGEYTAAPAPDDFHHDYLSERVPAQSPEVGGGEGGEQAPAFHVPTPYPVSGFARHQRLRRRIDTCWTLAALHRGLLGRNDPLRLEGRLASLEDAVEKAGPSPTGGGEAEALAEAERRVADALAARLLARAAGTQPGYLVLNPCSFIRRVALELEGAEGPLPVTGPVKALQIEGGKLRVVVEVPALGFAWLPRAGPPGTPPPVQRMRLADERCVRNEFFEAEVDPATGALRSICDRRTGVPRLGQRLVFNPGSEMQASAVKVTSAGPALGEIVTEGALLGEQRQVLAKFRQRFRAWLGRPILELRVELYPEQPPAGPPWHAYYGARFAWRDERALLLRGVGGTGYVTTHPRPQTPDYLELRAGRHSTALFPGGLPFHRRHETRMLDMILVPPGETAHVFDLGIGLDREHPMQTALGLTTPVPVCPTEKGPPHIGATGWLFHLDSANLVLTGLRPGGAEVRETGAAGPADRFDAVTARLLECAALGGQAELRCVRGPARAVVLDARGVRLLEAGVSGDAAQFSFSPGDFMQLQVEFS